MSDKYEPVITGIHLGLGALTLVGIFMLMATQYRPSTAAELQLRVQCDDKVFYLGPTTEMGLVYGPCEAGMVTIEKKEEKKSDGK